MPSRETISLLRVPLLVLLVALLLAASAIFASLQFRSSQSVIYNSANASLIQVRSKLQTTQMEERSLQTYTTKFHALAARGLFNEQKRLDWLENLKRLSIDHHLIELEFDLRAERTLSAAAPSAPNIEILSSPLQLKMSLGHEEDLFNFLNAIRTLPQGFYSVENCDIKRKEITSQADAANIQADCNLEWLTFKAKKARSTTN